MQIRSVNPYLIVDGAADAIDWYRTTWGAEEVTRWTGGAGRIAHAEIHIGSSVIFIGDEHPHYEEIHAPPRVGGTPVYLDIETDDVVELFGRAIAAGATEIRTPTDPQQGAVHRRRCVTRSATSGSSRVHPVEARSAAAMSRPMRVRGHATRSAPTKER